MTRFPFFTIRRHRCEPIKPAPPVTNTVFLLPVIFEHYLVSSPSSMMFQSLSSTRVFRDAGRGAGRRGHRAETIAKALSPNTAKLPSHHMGDNPELDPAAAATSVVLSISESVSFEVSEECSSGILAPGEELSGNPSVSLSILKEGSGTSSDAVPPGSGSSSSAVVISALGAPARGFAENAASQFGYRSAASGDAKKPRPA